MILSANDPGAGRTSARRRVAIVTGGTDGLGRELVRRLCARGDHVYVVARSVRDITVVAPGAIFVAADAGRADFPGVIAAALDRDAVEKVDLLIHNAADGWYGDPTQMPADRAEALLNVNTVAPIALTRCLADRVLAARGQVMFIGSIAAFVPATRYAVYAASKAALDGFARSLQAEWAHRARVNVMHPGPIATGFHARAGMKNVDLRRMPSVEAVAAATLAQIEGGRWRAFSSFPITLIALLSRWFTRPVDTLARLRERKQSGAT
jgi:short-subunit dehydrogenase